MKVLHVSTSDFSGGAARAAYRIHQAQVTAGIDSSMLVLHKGTSDTRVKAAPQKSLARRVVEKIQRRWIAYRRRDWRTDNPILHTFSEASAQLIEYLNACDADILNLHWVAGMLSVTDIGQLRKPIVWTMHDMWPFCGGEHYAPDDAQARFRVGYRPDNRPPGEAGPDLNQLTWKAKRRAWAAQKFKIISPSHWLAECVHSSALMQHYPVHVVPNPLDTDYPWRPIPRDVARPALGLPPLAKLILMGADGGLRDPRKGGDLMRIAISNLIEKMRDDEIRLLIYGQEASSGPESAWPCPVHWLGAVRDDRVLALAYAAADVMIVPSRQDNLPNTALEAQACGTPVVAFDIGGLPDIVDHRETGWLAPAFDTEKLCDGIEWILADALRARALGLRARERAVNRFTPQKVASEYLRIYHDALSSDDHCRLTSTQEQKPCET